MNIFSLHVCLNKRSPCIRVDLVVLQKELSIAYTQFKSFDQLYDLCVPFNISNNEGKLNQKENAKKEKKKKEIKSDTKKVYLGPQFKRNQGSEGSNIGILGISILNLFLRF